MTTIKKKAHLGDRKIVNETIPEGVTTIEDWAYAHCKLLNKIYIPDTVVSISPKTFDGCDNLQEVFIYKGEDVLNDNPHLLALSIKTWANDINEFVLAASKPDRFYSIFDLKLTKYLEENDDVGFDPFLAGGEEDYEDDDNDIDLFIAKRQVEKCILIYERILSEDAGHTINKDTKDSYIEYLKLRRTTHAFDALLKDDIYVSPYRKVYFALDLISAKEASKLLEVARDDKELSSILINVSIKESGDLISEFKL